MKNFLPYKESIAIKEIGFDEPCLGAWTNIDKKPEFSYNKKPTKYSKMFTKKSPHCVAPLYQEAFDWFTEQGLIQIEPIQMVNMNMNFILKVVVVYLDLKLKTG